MRQARGPHGFARHAWLAAAACIAACLAVHIGPAHAADPVVGPEAREIAALIEALGSSGCRFWRNGRWHEGSEARAHLQRKYDRARKRGLAGSAEDFIERAASRSSLSGKPYRVRCPGQPDVDSRPWFRGILHRIRVDDA
jgi:Family of unknown function (DUF5329)